MRMVHFHTVVVQYVLVGISAVEFLQRGQDSCFCKLDGEVDDCSCTVESVDSFNNNNIYSRINSLVEKDYFRYYPVDLQQPCKFWPPLGQCALKDCSVQPCREDDVPLGIKNRSGQSKYNQASREKADCSQETSPADSLGQLDMFISEVSSEAFKSWSKHDDAQNNFCELDDESSPTLQYIDLSLNPERFTGYAGVDAHRIWKSIYEENCFGRPELLYGQAYMPLYEGTCLEKRVFYRMISGLHTSINTHLSARYFYPAKTAWEKDSWKMNKEEFQSRFDPSRTHGHGPQRLKNLYFAYLVELRALAKVAPYLQKEMFYTGKPEEDQETRRAVHELLEIVRVFPDHFDESKLFIGEALQLKEEIRLKFLNISRIMDCVGCEKCKLWGKVQVRGMGTALKILFAPHAEPAELSADNMSRKFQLSRVEIVSLFNAFGRLSTSIKYIEDFRRLIRS